MLLALLTAGAESRGDLRDLEVVYQWPLLSFATPAGYPADRDFRADRSIFNSIEVGWDRVFLTTPRIWKGNPATLVWVPRGKSPVPSDPSPPLQVSLSTCLYMHNCHEKEEGGKIIDIYDGL